MRKLTTAAAIAAVFFVAPAQAETYRLIHAIGNDENEVARDLTKAECDAMKADQKAVAEALGVHSERLGLGSITCLEEGFFED